MLALLGAGAVLALLAAITFNRLSPLVALILVPVFAGLAGGFGLDTFKFAIDGVEKIAPNAAMFVFAILFFGTMTDAGLIDPILARILRLVGNRPTRIVLASAFLALLVHLDGSGAVCFLVVIPAMLPLYEKLGLDRRVLACVTSMAAGVNFLPWTGPTVRAAAVLHTTTLEIFRPMIPVQIVGLLIVFSSAWWLGRREEHRIVGNSGFDGRNVVFTLSDSDRELRRPNLFWLNCTLTIAVMAALIISPVHPAAIFMFGAAIALLVNYPHAEQQRQRVDAHARAALMMAGILLAAGAFTGIMEGTGALRALAKWGGSLVPEGMGSHIPFGLSLVAMPLSMLFDPDSYYFGVMPVIGGVYSHLGGHALQIAQASLVGQMTAGFPVSPLTPATFLVAGLSGIDLSAHQRFTFPFLYFASLCMALACVAVGLFPF
jgi:citrate-Mg2+:H+ or citrate-Ca2+:H+ symporter, CitMHS family